MKKANLQKIINYIEDNLDKEIDVENVSKLVSINSFIFQRIFAFLTDMTFVEYVKKRRLSKALEDIKNTDEKIIDIIFKYQFKSVSSFNRMFKQVFGITPSQCRCDKTNYKIVPIINFEDLTSSVSNIEFKIKKIVKTNLYCYHVESDDYDNLLYKIRKLYENIHDGKLDLKYDSPGLYGIYKFKNGIHHYYVGSEKKIENSIELVINDGEYIEFKVDSRNQDAILRSLRMINDQWIPSTDMSIQFSENFEYYLNDNCFIYVPINSYHI